MSYITLENFKKDFLTAQMLGSGQTATVFKIQERSSRKIFALRVAKSNNSEEHSKNFSDIEIPLCLDTEYVPKIYFYYIEPMVQRPAYRGNHSQMLWTMGVVMEYCQLDLQKEILSMTQKRMKYSRKQIFDFLKQMSQVLAQMQRKGYIHRDIKPPNILVKLEEPRTNPERKTYKLADFGYSVKESKYSSQDISGTRDYVSPKVLEKFDNHNLTIAGMNHKDDIYSLGMTVLEMMLLKRISQRSINTRLFDQIEKQYGKELVNILMKMLEHTEKSRVDCVELEDLIKKVEKGEKQADLDHSMLDQSEEMGIAQGFVTPLKANKVRSAELVSTMTQTSQKMSQVSQAIAPQADINSETEYQDSSSQVALKASQQNSQATTRMVESHFFNLPGVTCFCRVNGYFIFGTRGAIYAVSDQDPNVVVKAPLSILSNDSDSGYVKYDNFTVDSIELRQANVIIVGHGECFFYIQENKLIEDLKDSKKIDPSSTQTASSNGQRSRVDEIRVNFQIIPKTPHIHCVQVVGGQVYFGHNNGSVSQFNGPSVQMEKKPISNIRIKDDFLYYSTPYGMIKRVPLDAIRFRASLSVDQTFSYDCQEEIVSIDFVESQNQSTQSTQHYLTAATSEGAVLKFTQNLECISQSYVSDRGIIGVYKTDVKWQSIKGEKNQLEKYNVFQVCPTLNAENYYVTWSGTVIDSRGNELFQCLKEGRTAFGDAKILLIANEECVQLLKVKESTQMTQDVRQTKMKKKTCQQITRPNIKTKFLGAIKKTDSSSRIK